MSTSGSNLELKAHAAEGLDLEAALLAAGGRLARDHTEVDTYFDTELGRLKYRESTIRPSRLVAYLREDLPQARQSRFERAEVVEDGGKVTKSILSASLGESRVVEKHRRTYEGDGWLANLDRVLGHDFVEIEVFDGPGYADAPALMERLTLALKIRRIDVVPFSYEQIASIDEKSRGYRAALGERLRDLVLIDGPSGAGKSSLVHALRERLPDPYRFLKRYTSRAARPGDDATDEYTFVDAERFATMASTGEFLESRNFLFGMSYGISWEQVLEALSEPDAARAFGVMNLGNVRHVREFVPEVRRVLITAPLDQLQDRLERRGAHDASALEERLDNARMANEALDLYDVVVWNEDGSFDESLDRLSEAVVG